VQSVFLLLHLGLTCGCVYRYAQVGIGTSLREWAPVKGRRRGCVATASLGPCTAAAVVVIVGRTSSDERIKVSEAAAGGGLDAVIRDGGEDLGIEGMRMVNVE
jgi:hypothetical protein